MKFYTVDKTYGEFEGNAFELVDSDQCPYTMKANRQTRFVINSITGAAANEPWVNRQVNSPIVPIIRSLRFLTEKTKEDFAKKTENLDFLPQSVSILKGLFGAVPDLNKIPIGSSQGNDSVYTIKNLINGWNCYYLFNPVFAFPVPKDLQNSRIRKVTKYLFSLVLSSTIKENGSLMYGSLIISDGITDYFRFSQEAKKRKKEVLSIEDIHKLSKSEREFHVRYVETPQTGTNRLVYGPGNQSSFSWNITESRSFFKRGEQNLETLSQTAYLIRNTYLDKEAVLGILNKIPLPIPT